MRRAGLTRASAALLALPAIAALFLAPASPAAAAPGVAKTEPELVLHAPAFVGSADGFSFEIEQRGTLAGRPLGGLVFIDSNMMQRFTTDAKSSRVTLTGLELETGAHLLKIKSGTHEAEARFRYQSPRQVAIAAALLLALIVGAGFILRRRSARRD